MEMGKNLDTGKIITNKNATDEKIELIEVLRVIWKWKYLILIGTVAFALTMGIYSLSMAKIYSIEMVLKPGILKIGSAGEIIYIDTPDNIKALIDSGTFNTKIVRYLMEKIIINEPTTLRIKVILPENSNTIKVSYESEDIELGTAILDQLRQSLLNEYSNLVQYYDKELEKDLRLKNAAIENNKNFKLSYEINVSKIEKRIQELKSEIESLQTSTAYLTKERDKFLSTFGDEDNILTALLYSNTIQQNLGLSNSFKSEVNTYELQKERELQKISELENRIQALLTEIANLEFKKAHIQNIQILQPPISSVDPVKPKIKLNIMIAVVVGFLLMFILAFFFEYLLKHTRK